MSMNVRMAHINVLKRGDARTHTATLYASVKKASNFNMWTENSSV